MVQRPGSGDPDRAPLGAALLQAHLGGAPPEELGRPPPDAVVDVAVDLLTAVARRVEQPGVLRGHLPQRADPEAGGAGRKHQRDRLPGQDTDQPPLVGPEAGEGEPAGLPDVPGDALT